VPITDRRWTHTSFSFYDTLWWQRESIGVDSLLYSGLGLALPEW